MPELFSLVGGVALAATLLVGTLGGGGLGLSLGGSSEPSPPDTGDDIEPVARVVDTCRSVNRRGREVPS